MTHRLRSSELGSLSPQLPWLLCALLAEPGRTLCSKAVCMQENCGDILSSYTLLSNEFTFFTP